MIYQNHHVHSYYSNILVPDVVISREEIAIRAKELGHGILSSTEHGWQSRYIETYELAKKYGLKFLFGVEAYIVKNRLEKDATNAHIILLAKNENGRKSINRILSEASLTGFYYRPRIDLELLFSLPSNDVWITSACVGGLWKYEDANELMIKIHDYFGNNFFLEVQDHYTQSQKDLNSRIINLSNQHNIQIIFGCDTHYITYEQAKDRDDYLLSKHITYEDEKGWYLDYPDGEEVFDRFKEQGVLTHSQIEEAINNTNIFLEVEEYNSPVFEKTVKLPTLYPDNTQEEKDKILTDLIWCEWEVEKNNVKSLDWKKYEKEINKELEVIIETGMSDYFLLDYEIVKKGKELGGHITMTGRGSGPSFYTCKLLGLTTIDRISATVKLFPERFITKERILEAGSLPDIDLNLGNPAIFAQAQIEVLGENHSYPLIAFGTLRPKAAWKLYARAKDIDFETANRISEQIDKYEMKLKHEDEDEKEELNVLDFIEPEFHELFLESGKYLGIVSDAKIHPCAFLLYNGNIKEEIGLLRVKENICTVMDGLWAENYKFIKNDLLKVAVVDLIYRVYERIGIEPHPLPELIKLCEKDQKVWDIYKTACTMGINQMEQISTSGRVAKYAPQNISEVSAFAAAIRPGFQSNYKQFEAREPFSYGIPSLDNLIQTKEFPQSYLIYQENAMSVMAYSGISISQTYEVIKNIAKKRVEKVLKYKDKFLEGMTKKIIKSEGKTEEESKQIADMTWKIIENSSRYSFNASHAYSVAGDSLYGAYLKSHYPFEFYEVFLQLLEDDGDKDRLARAKEEAREKFKIQFPPYRFGQDNRTIKATPETREIASSLTSIKGFNSSIGINLYEMAQKKYEGFLEFLIEAEESNRLSSKFSELIQINYFEQFGNNKKLLLFFEEFTKGENKYLRTYVEKTKAKRIEKLHEFWESIPNERLPIYGQIESEREILGYVQATYPINKRYLYVLSLETKYSPRANCYCLGNGKIASLKIQNKVYDHNVFIGGDILFVKNFEEKPTVSYVNGKYIYSDTETTWWISNYSIISAEEFNKLVS